MKTLIIAGLITLSPALALLAEDAPKADAPAATQPAERKLVTGIDDVLKDVPAEFRPSGKDATTKELKEKAAKLAEWCKEHAKDYRVKASAPFLESRAGKTNGKPDGRYSVATENYVKTSVGWRRFTVSAKVSEAQYKPYADGDITVGKVIVPLEGLVDTLKIKFDPHGHADVWIRIEQDAKVGEAQPVSPKS